MDRERLEALFHNRGFPDFKWIKPANIQVAQWVRFRCMFGCPNYGKSATCPPQVPSVEECRQMFLEYEEAAIFHFEKAFENPRDRKGWSAGISRELISMEREVFLEGYYKCFLVPFDACGLCRECTGSRENCRNPMTARPGADALGIDVYATARSVGYPIQVLRDYHETMNRYAFLLVE